MHLDALLAVFVADSDVCKTDGFARAVRIRAGNACNAQSEIAARQQPHSARHLHGNRLGYCAVFVEKLIINAKQLVLNLV